MYDFSVDCNAIDKSNTLNIRKYLMIKILNDHKNLMINYKTIFWIINRSS